MQDSVLNVDGLLSRELALALQGAVGTALSNRTHQSRGSTSGRSMRRAKTIELRGRFAIVEEAERFHVIWKPSSARATAVDISQMSLEDAVRAICSVG